MDTYKHRNKKIITLIVFMSLSTIGYTQTFVIPDSIVKITYERYKQDSMRFVERFNILMNSQTRSELEDAASRLDRQINYRWIKLHSDEIINKIGDAYKTNSHIANLLSLTNVPDSIRTELLNTPNRLRRARLGDSTAIAYYINEYISCKNENDKNFREGCMIYYARLLLYMDSEKAREMIFRDMESTRIIKQCEMPDHDDPNR